MEGQAAFVMSRMSPALAEVGQELHIVTRDTTRWSQVRARLFSSDRSSAPISVAAWHPSQAGLCLVLARASGDGDPKRQATTRDLAERLGNEYLAWRLVLTHEAAHCLRNPAVLLASEQDPVPANAGPNGRSNLKELASFASEAYADAFAVGDLWAERGRSAEPVGFLMKAWRQDASLAPSWQTAQTLDAMLAQLDRLPPNTRLSIDQVDQIAWNVVDRQLLARAQSMGISPGHAAPLIEQVRRLAARDPIGKLGNPGKGTASS